MLYETTHHVALHRLAAALEREALDTWAKDHAKGYALGDALALKAQTIYTTVERKPGGNVSVTVCVQGRGYTHDELYYFSLQKRRFGWVVEGRESPLKV